MNEVQKCRAADCGKPVVLAQDERATDVTLDPRVPIYCVTRRKDGVVSAMLMPKQKGAPVTFMATHHATCRRPDLFSRAQRDNEGSVDDGKTDTLRRLDEVEQSIASCGAWLMQGKGFVDATGPLWIVPKANLERIARAIAEFTGTPLDELMRDWTDTGEPS